jgi:hypothetical protein
METSVVRDRTVLAVRGVRNNMAKRAIKARTCTRHWSNLYGSVHVLLWRTLASLRARCFASLKCIPSLGEGVDLLEKGLGCTLPE